MREELEKSLKGFIRCFATVTLLLISEWGKQNLVTFNATKTQTSTLSNKRNIDAPAAYREQVDEIPKRSLKFFYKSSIVNQIDSLEHL